MTIEPNEPLTLIKGVEIGQIPATPLIPPMSDDIVKQASDLLLKFGAHYGFPVAYKQEQNGRLIQHVLPNPKTEFAQISSSSKALLKMHTETAFHPHKPDVLILMCLRGDKNAPTTYVNFGDILRNIDVGLMYELMRPQFYIQPDLSFKENKKQYDEWLVPVINFKHKKFRFIFDEDLMRGKTEVAFSALECFKKLVDENIKEIVLEDGDVLIIDNHQVAHGRKPFQPRYDGTDRWLMRLMVKEQLPDKRECVVSTHPVITTEFCSPQKDKVAFTSA